MGDDLTGDEVLDAALNYIKTNCAELCMCSQKPTNYTEATSTYMLAKTPMSPISFGSPTNLDGGGRKMQVVQQSDFSVTNTGDAVYVALVSGSLFLRATPCQTCTMTAGGTTTCASWYLEFEG